MHRLPTEVHKRIMSFMHMIDGQSMRLSTILLSKAKIPFRYYLDICLKRYKIDPDRFISMMKIWNMQLAEHTLCQIITGKNIDRITLYLPATGTRIYGWHMVNLIRKYMAGDNNIRFDEQAARDARQIDVVYIPKVKHPSTTHSYSDHMSKFTLIFVIGSLQEIFNNCAFDFDKISFNSNILQVYDWYAIINKDSFLDNLRKTRLHLKN